LVVVLAEEGEVEWVIVESEAVETPLGLLVMLTPTALAGEEDHAELGVVVVVAVEDLLTVQVDSH
jgi:hypothetical protein